MAAASAKPHVASWHWRPDASRGPQDPACGVVPVAADYRYDAPTSHFYRHPDYRVPAGRETSAASQYSTELHGEVYGPFAEIRKDLDYAWHPNYTRQRQAWQDGLIRGLLANAVPKEHPWVVFTCGAMGAGKGHVMNWLSRHADFPLEHMVCIDPDKFKIAMPEWHGYVEHNLEDAGTMCHRESGLLQELAQEVALRSGCHTWIDGSLSDHRWYSEVFSDLRARFPRYRIAILHVHCTPDTVYERAERRGRETGRFVPEDLLRRSIAETRESMRLLGPLADFVAEVENESDPPWITISEERPRACARPGAAEQPLPAWFPSSACGKCIALQGPLLDFVTKVNSQLEAPWIKVRCCGKKQKKQLARTAVREQLVGG